MAAGTQRSVFSRVVLGSLKGLALPFLLLFVVIVDLGINSLLGIKNPTARYSLLSTIFPGSAGLRLAAVALIAIFATVLGAFAGHAVAGTKGALVGAGLGYLLGSMSGGAIMELVSGRPHVAEDFQRPRSGRVPRETKIFARDAFRFKFSTEWKIDDRDEDFDPDHRFTVSTAGSSMIIFVIHKCQRDLGDLLEDCLVAHKKNIRGGSTAEFKKWGEHVGRGIILSGKFQGVKKTTLRLFAFQAAGKTFMITEYAPADEWNDSAPGFELIEDSFEILERRKSDATRQDFMS